MITLMFLSVTALYHSHAVLVRTVAILKSRLHDTTG